MISDGLVRQRLPMRVAVGSTSLVAGFCLLLGLSSLAGCATASHSGPAIQTMRLPLPMSASKDERSARADEWNAWANQHLQSGDVVFLRGENRVALDLINLAEFITTLTDSPWSHVGLVVIEDGAAYVYDIRLHGGMFRTPFGELLTNPQVYAVAVQRPTGETATAAPQAAAYVQEMYRQRIPFDQRFDSEDQSRLYCAELVEMAYRSAGVPLSQPARMAELPGYGASPYVEQIIRVGGRVNEQQLMYVPGNDELGLWANPDLQPVLVVPDTRTRPAELPPEGEPTA